MPFPSFVASRGNVGRPDIPNPGGKPPDPLLKSIKSRRTHRCTQVTTGRSICRSTLQEHDRSTRTARYGRKGGAR